jgi:glycosyltransferase involved in cell wall biosynthesis
MRKVNPLVSVIVPNYNHENYLEKRLECIFNQTYPNFEVILLDDCSSDKSQEILLKYAKNPKVSHCVFNHINSGNTFLQWNKGIALAEGDYIWIAESDDFCEFNFLKELTTSLIEDDKIVLAFCQSNRVDEKGNITGSWLNHTDNLDASLFLTSFVMEGNKFIERFLIHKNVIPNASAVVFRKQSAIELGFIESDSFLKYCGDWLYYIKLICNSKIVFNHNSLNSFRYHSQSVIAIAIRTRKLDSNNGVEINLRTKIVDFLSYKKIVNLSNILKINNQILNELKYGKALYLIKNKNKLKGFIIFISIFNIVLNKYRLKKKLKSKIRKFLDLIKNN